MRKSILLWLEKLFLSTRKNQIINKLLRRSAYGICALFFLLLFFYGYNDKKELYSKHYISSFTLTEPFSHESELPATFNVEALFHAYGFNVDSKSDLRVKITTNSLKDTCLSNPAYGMQMYFIRISICHSEQEYYRIQYNKNSAIVVKDIEMLIKKMKEDIGKW